MLKIALCDDDAAAREHIGKLLEEYLTEKGLPYRLYPFSGAMALLDALERERFSALVLDILMPGLTGIQAARELRRFDRNMPILFLTSSPEFAVESYQVEAFSYLLKPVHRQDLAPVLDRLLVRLRHEAETLLLSTSSGLLRLPWGSIEVLEINSRKLLFYLEDGSQTQISGTLAEYEPQLMKTGSFLKVHRSYLVNMAAIQRLGSLELTTYSGRTVPISRLLSGTVRQQYMDFLFQKEGVL